MHLIWGFFFVVTSSTVVQILPANLFRYSLDLVWTISKVYRAFDMSNVQDDFFSIFANGILISPAHFSAALLRGGFCIPFDNAYRDYSPE